LKTVVIEGGDEIGGLCILRGCMPSKTLLESASRAESIRRFTVLPLNFTETAGHLTPTMKLRRAVVTREFAGEIETMYDGALGSE
jgi:long-chain acyl-CoA synthetase